MARRIDLRVSIEGGGEADRVRILDHVKTAGPCRQSNRSSEVDLPPGSPHYLYQKKQYVRAVLLFSLSLAMPAKKKGNPKKPLLSACRTRIVLVHYAVDQRQVYHLNQPLKGRRQRCTHLHRPETAQRPAGVC